MHTLNCSLVEKQILFQATVCTNLCSRCLRYMTYSVATWRQRHLGQSHSRLGLCLLNHPDSSGKLSGCRREAGQATLQQPHPQHIFILMRAHTRTHTHTHTQTHIHTHTHTHTQTHIHVNTQTHHKCNPQQKGEQNSKHLTCHGQHTTPCNFKRYSWEEDFKSKGFQL